jgi:hypothetical protein
VDGSGAVFIADTGNNRVVKEALAEQQGLCINGACPPPIYTQSIVGSGLSAPYGVATDGAGNVYISDTGNNRILLETPTSSGYTQSVLVENGLSSPTGIAVDGSGDLFIANAGSGEVVEETLSGGIYTQSTVASGLSQPQGVYLDAAGDVYIADSGNNRVLLETPSNGGYAQMVIASGLNNPQSVLMNVYPISPNHVSGYGFIYIADSNNQRVLQVDVGDPQTLNFATTPVGGVSSDSPRAATLLNIGNAPLQFTVPSAGSNPSLAAFFGNGSGNIASAFTLNSGGAGDCPVASAGALQAPMLAAGATCQFSFSFTPNALDPGQANVQADTMSLVDNSNNGYFYANSTTQAVILSGNVIPGTPTITWAPPTAINYGTALSATQLDATANIQGTLVYTPGLGAVLAAGTQTLSVTFTPNDTADYTTVTATVQLVVNPISVASLSATSLSFGSLHVGSSSNSGTVTLTNPGDVALSITSIAVTGANASSFVFSNSCGTSLAAGANCVIDGQFAPTTIGAMTASVTITDNAGNSPQTIALSGTGTQGTQAITFAPPASPVSYGVAPVTLVATGGASGNPVTFSIVSGPGSLSGASKSLLTVTGAGTIVIAANQAGNTNYSAAPQVTQSIVVTAAVPAVLTSPTPSTTLTSSSVTFSWTAGSGVAQYDLHVGATGVGSSNIFAGTVSGQSQTVTGIPTTGGTLNVRLYSLIAGAWQYIDYTFTEASLAAPATMTSPAPGSTLTGTTAAFSWTAGSQVTQYDLHVGTTGVGSSNIFASTVAGQTKSLSGIPTTGGTLNVRLYSLIKGAWQYIDYTYTEFTVPAPATMTSPTPGSTLTSSSATFSWTAGTLVTQYDLHIGTTGTGSSNIFAGTVAGQTKTVTGIPTTGGTLNVRLYSLIKGAWQYIDYTYTETIPAVPAIMSSPTPGSALTGSSATFTWTVGTQVTQYDLHIGTTGVGSSNIFAGTVTGQSKTITGIPTTGGTLNVRLYSLISGAWQYNDYTYTEESPATPATMSTPTPGSALTGSSATFTWTAGTQVTQYDLHIGTTGVGSSNIFAGTVTGQSKTITGIPTTGGTLNVRLYSLIAGAWQYNDYTYTEQ